MKTWIDNKESIDILKDIIDNDKINIDLGYDEDNEKTLVEIRVYDKSLPEGKQLVNGYKQKLTPTEILAFCLTYPRGLKYYDFEIIKR